MTRSAEVNLACGMMVSPALQLLCAAYMFVWQTDERTLAMTHLTDSPFLLLVLAFLILWACAWIGAKVLGRYAAEGPQAREDFRTVLAACLTLLGLIVGFSFSMAVSRYDLRQKAESAEANAIGTEYLRADLLPPSEAETTRGLLRSYLTQRIQFFNTRDSDRFRQLAEQTTRLQLQMWSEVRMPAVQPNQFTALAVSGMNDVLSSQGNTQAAWGDRIPAEAWALMGLIAILCNLMLGVSARHLQERSVLFVLPLVTAIAFFLIADIDSPAGGGVIHVMPENLLDLGKLMH